MGKRMTCKGGMIYFNIQTKIIQQIILPQKANDSFTVIVVLVLGWFTRFGFNKELPFETILSSIVSRNMEEFRKVFLFTFHICIQQAHITFPASPKNIIFPTQLYSSIQCSFYLCSAMRQHMKVWIGSGTIHISFIGEKICSAPQ